MKLNLLQAVAAGMIMFACSNAQAGIIDIDFTVDGDTYTAPWKITNNSTDGILLESFVFDLRPLTTYCYDIDDFDCRPSASTPFSTYSGGAATGFVDASVTNIAGGPDYYDFLQINFSDFGFGETFSWLLDVDSMANATVYGNELIGSMAYAQMSDGKVYYGSLEAIPGNSDASRFVISSVSDQDLGDIVTDIPEPSTLAILSLGLMGLVRRVKS